jgi:peroxiredoxin
MLKPASKTIRHGFCLVIILITTSANAQISLVQNLIDKVEGYNNFSYQSINKLKDLSADTTVALNTELFLKASTDNLSGYLYSIETNHKTETFHKTDLYDGKKVTVLSLPDSTFFLEEGPNGAYSRSIIGGLRFIKDRYSSKPFKVILLGDTVINGTANAHFVAEVYDALDNGEHLFSYRHYYINKKTSLPSMVTIIGRYKYNGSVNSYYSETRYFDYKFDQPGITAAKFEVPSGFKPRKDNIQVSLLGEGTLAPDWTLNDVHGKAISLSQLKGKVVLLDFYFIGCSGCMLSLKPLNAIHEKYKDKDVVIASLTERDSKKAVLDFEKRYKIKYPGYLNAAEAVKSYHVTAFPTFYFIDKEGKIRFSFVGYNDDFEQKVTAEIDKLLSKN